MKPAYSARRRKLVIGSLAAAAVGVLPRPSNASQGGYVGVASAFTGPLAGPAQQLREGSILAIRHLNEKGMKVELRIADDGCRPDLAMQVARQFHAEKVVCVFGHFCSVASFVASRFYEERQIVQIIPTPVSYLPEGPPERYIFRMLPRGEFEARIAGRVLAGRFRDKG